MKDTKKPTRKSMSARKGKAEGSKAKKGREVALDEAMDERVRAIITDPGAKQGVKEQLDKLISQLGRALFDASLMPDIPERSIAEYMAVSNAYAYENVTGALTDEAREAAANLAAYVERHEPKDTRLARVLLSLAFPTKKTAGLARRGGTDAGSIPDLVQDLAHDLDILVFHPDILPAALPVILREARATVKVEGYRWRAVRDLLRDLEKAAEEGAEGRR